MCTTEASVQGGKSIKSGVAKQTGRTLSVNDATAFSSLDVTIWNLWKGFRIKDPSLDDVGIVYTLTKQYWQGKKRLITSTLF